MPFADDTIEVLDEVLFTPFILRSDFVFLISIENGTIIFMLRKPPVNHVFSAISSTSIFVSKNKTYDDTRRSCRNYYVLQGTQSNL